MSVDNPREADRRCADTEPCLSAWQRLCVNGVATDALLGDFEAWLDRPEVEAELDALQAREEYPEPVLQQLRDRGLMRVFAPGEDGDNSRATVFHISCLNALTARRDTSLAVTISVNALGLLPAYAAATPEQMNEINAEVQTGAFASLLLSEVRHGSNLLANRARAERGVVDAQDGFHGVADAEPCTHFRLTGEKDLINGGNRHKLMFVFVRTRNFDVDPATIEPLAARADFTMFWMKRGPDVVPLPRWHTLPARGADISGVRFEGVVLPAAQVLGRENGGMTLAQKTLTLSRGGVASLASGCLSRARDVACAWATRRIIYGVEPIVALDAIADHLIRVEALDRLVAAIAVRTVALLNKLGLGASHYTGVAKSIACSLAEEGVREGQRIMGARALLNAYPYERLMRDIVLYGVFDGTNHVMLQELGHRLALEARRAGDAESSAASRVDSVQTMRDVYSAPPAPMTEVLRGRASRVVLPLEEHLRALGELPGDVPVAPIASACDLLFALVREAERMGLWREDQEFRLRAAELFATLEGLVAILELCDPTRREALGVPAMLGGELPLDRPVCRFTVAMLGRRVVAGMRDLALAFALPETWPGSLPTLHAVEAALSIDDVETRRLCRAAVRAGVSA